MSLISIFTDAFKRASTARSDAAKDAIKSGSAGTLGSTPQSGAGSFTPLRPAPESSPSPDLGDVKIEAALASDPTPIPYPNTGAARVAAEPEEDPMITAGADLATSPGMASDIKGESTDDRHKSELASRAVQDQEGEEEELLGADQGRFAGALSGDPEEGGESKFEALNLTRLSSDPMEGGEFKIGSPELTRLPADPEEGGESAFALRLDRGSSDPEEGGEVKVASLGLNRSPADPEEGGESEFALRLDRGSSDPEEGGESKFEAGKIFRRPGGAREGGSSKVADQEEGRESEFEAGKLLQRRGDAGEGGASKVADQEEGGDEQEFEAGKLLRRSGSPEQEGEFKLASPELTRLSSDLEDSGADRMSALNLAAGRTGLASEDSFDVKIEHIVASDADLDDDEPSTLVQLAPSARVDGVVGPAGLADGSFDDLDLDTDLDGGDEDLEV